MSDQPSASGREQPRLWLLPVWARVMLSAVLLVLYLAALTAWISARWWSIDSPSDATELFRTPPVNVRLILGIISITLGFGLSAMVIFTPLEAESWKKVFACAFIGCLFFLGFGLGGVIGVGAFLGVSDLFVADKQAQELRKETHYLFRDPRTVLTIPLTEIESVDYIPDGPSGSYAMEHVTVVTLGGGRIKLTEGIGKEGQAKALACGLGVPLNGKRIDC